MANYRAARAVLGKGPNAGEGAAGLSKSSAKKGAKKSAVKNHAAMRQSTCRAHFWWT